MLGDTVVKISISLNHTYVVGSSKNKTNGLSINSNAIDKRFFCPPDKFEHLVFFETFKCNVFKILSI
jgi:hypothetical protein